tara:strand:+ start:44 stop:535 length:492 start_codon:yes stop_codon:yes gene_type:complete
VFKVVDNYLPESDFFVLKKAMESEFFPWYLVTKSSHKSSNRFDYHMGHAFYVPDNGGTINSGNFNVIIPLIKKIKVNTLIRVKANLKFVTNKIIKSELHIDQERFDCKVAIFYVDTNNGYTMIGDKKVDSVENRIVFFNGKLKHYGTSCTDKQRRIVINFNYI